jgi:hypothetical protein
MCGNSDIITPPLLLHPVQCLEGRQAGGILHAENLLNMNYQMDDGRDTNI